jgi:hypothetical protein
VDALKRKVIIAAVLLVLLCAVFVASNVVGVFRPQAGGGDILVKAFGCSGAAVAETNINAYASAADVFLDKDEVVGMVKSLAEGMDLDYEQAERVENFSLDYNQLSVIGKNKEGYSVVIIVHSMDFTGIEDGPGGFESNIVVDVALGGDMEELPHTERKVKDLVEGYMEGARTNCCIVGSYAERVPQDDIEAIIGSILQSAGASEVERAVYDGFVSISAYTPDIGRYVEMGENRVNLNVAMRYNSFEGRTYIWLGSPVISLEY